MGEDLKTGEKKSGDPVRRCAGCGKRAGKSEFIRIVRLPGETGELVFDPELRIEGRSLYFCKSMECFMTLMRRRAPEKLIKQSVPDEIRDTIISYLSRTERVRMT